MFTFKKQNRLLTSTEFKHIMTQGHKSVTKRLVLVAKPIDKTESRLGLVVSKRNVGNSVQRNLVKRRLREIFRLTHHKIPLALDIVVIARHQALEVDAEVLSKDFSYGLDRLVRQLGPKKQPVSVDVLD